MMLLTRPLIAAALLSLVASSALAQSGSPQERRACNSDARRLCSRVIKDGDMAVYSCLQQNGNRLRKACRKVIFGQ